MNIDGLIYSLIAQETDRNPSQTLQHIWLNVRDKVLGELDQHRLDELGKNLDLEDVFKSQLVINPQYWQKRLSRLYRFYFLTTSTRRYEELLTTMQTELPRSSHFVCYGDIDGIVRTVGTLDELELVEEFLRENDLLQFSVPVKAIPFYYGYPVPIKKTLHEPNVDRDIIDAALEGRNEAQDPAIVQALIDAGMILGRVHFEDVHRTGRIRTFIGIEFSRILRPHERLQFESTILEMNDAVRHKYLSSPVTSIYSCQSVFSYLLEAIFDNQEQLDYFTDQLQQVEPAVRNTVTIIVAKAEYEPVRFAAPTDDWVARADTLKQIEGALQPMLDKMREQLPPDIDGVFLAAPPEIKLQALTFYNDVVAENLLLQTLEPSELIEYVFEFLRGILLQKQSTLKSAGVSFVRDVVERRHNEFVGALIDTFFDGDPARIQAVLKSDNALWERWGLMRWSSRVYPIWNKHKVYGNVFEVPAEITRAMDFVGATRNEFAHTGYAKSLPMLIQQGKEMFNYSFRILAWLSETRPKFDHPAMRAMVVFARESGTSAAEEQRQLLLIMRTEQIEQTKVLEKLDVQADERYEFIRESLAGLRKGVRINLDRTFQIYEELVIPQLDNNERTLAERSLETLKRHAADFPYSVTLNILSDILGSALGLT